jgi:bifunctional non-homologous end joining protein LigD
VALARHRRAPVGFIRPCQPVLATEVPTGEGWIHELKWDGYRIIVRRNEGVVRLWSRYGRNWEKEFPRIVGRVGSVQVKRVLERMATEVKA